MRTPRRPPLMEILPGGRIPVVATISCDARSHRRAGFNSERRDGIAFGIDHYNSIINTGSMPASFITAERCGETDVTLVRAGSSCT